MYVFRQVISSVLFSFGVMGGYYGIRFLFLQKKQYIENFVLGIFCLASAVWSIAYSHFIMQDVTEQAGFFHSIGSAASIAYLICAQMLVCKIGGLKWKYRVLLDGISFLGIIVYILAVRTGTIEYYIDRIGMVASNPKGIAYSCYQIYMVIVMGNIFFGCIHMIRKAKQKRIRIFGYKILLVEFLIFGGSGLDVVFVKYGIGAISAMTIMQHIGMIVLIQAVMVYNSVRMNIENISGFVYYSLSMPVLGYDVKKRLKIVNEAAAKFLNVNQQEMEEEGISVTELFQLKEEQIFEFEGKQKSIDAFACNGVYCNLAVNRVHDTYGDEIGYIIILTDLTERMQNLQNLEEAKLEAEAANRSKSVFLANMSHEIRTPMNAVVGLSEIVLNMEISNKVKECVSDIKNSSLNLLAIINDLLDLSKIESGKMELDCQPYYTSNLFRDVHLIIGTQAKKKGLEFSMDFSSEIPNKLYGDRVRLRGIFINLLNNAVKYTKKGGLSFHVSIANKDADSAEFTYKIKDTGTGIKKEDLPSIFESFSQVDRKVHEGTEGTGLGLAIVKGYVELMGGQILVKSVYGEGTEFTIIVRQTVLDWKPMETEFTQDEEVASIYNLGDMKIKDTKVLVVDDNLVNLKVAKKSMEHYGLDVDMADSGEEAIACCRQVKYDIVFMDQMMPNMDGKQAMEHIRKLDAHYAIGGKCKIVALTANAISGVRDELIEQGFDEYLGKPINFRQLERVLKEFQ